MLSPILTILSWRSTSSTLAACAAGLGLLLMGMTVPAQSAAPAQPSADRLEARFRGCETAGWCRFWIAALDPLAQSLHRVRPDGIPQGHDNDAIAKAVRNRLGAMLSNMIHQDKRILLGDLREVGDGTFAATVTVDGVNLASDPVVLKLLRSREMAREAP